VDIVRAFDFAFKDPQWVTKLGITVGITLVSIILTPFLIGLAGWAVLLGYQIALVGNIRAAVEYPLPRWDDISEYFSTGSQALIAAILYSLPLLVIACLALTPGFFLEGNAAGGAISIVVCCLFPFLLVYLLLLIPVYGLGMARFVDDPRLATFLQFGDLFATVRARQAIAVQYVIYSLLASAIMGVLASIPCVGWIAQAALTVPVTGALTGQFGTLMIRDKPKR
jgi:hypothetical protein